MKRGHSYAANGETGMHRDFTSREEVKSSAEVERWLEEIDPIPRRPAENILPAAVLLLGSESASIRTRLPVLRRAARFWQIRLKVLASGRLFSVRPATDRSFHKTFVRAISADFHGATTSSAS